MATQLLGGHLNTEIKPFRFSVLACVNDLILPENQHQVSYVSFFFFFLSQHLLLCIDLVVLAVCCYPSITTGLSLVVAGGWVGVGGQLLVVVHRLLNAVASPLWSTGSSQSLQHAGSVAVVCGLDLLRSMWNLPKPEIEPISPALAGGFFVSFTDHRGNKLNFF